MDGWGESSADSERGVDVSDAIEAADQDLKSLRQLVDVIGTAKEGRNSRQSAAAKRDSLKSKLKDIQGNIGKARGLDKRAIDKLMATVVTMQRSLQNLSKDLADKERDQRIQEEAPHVEHGDKSPHEAARKSLDRVQEMRRSHEAVRVIRAGDIELKVEEEDAIEMQIQEEKNRGLKAMESDVKQVRMGRVGW